MKAGKDTIYLITRADDCGSNLTANRAIEEACRFGMIKNVSVMATGSALEDAAARLIGTPGIAFGVHLTLNAEWDRVRWSGVSPQDEIASLLDGQGCFYQTTAAMRAARPSLDEVFTELDAQLSKLRALGFPLTYADEHMYFGHVIDGFEPRFAKWCEREGLVNHRLFRTVCRVRPRRPDT